jgi:hypothetical protein
MYLECCSTKFRSLTLQLQTVLMGRISNCCVHAELLTAVLLFSLVLMLRD